MRIFTSDGTAALTTVDQEGGTFVHNGTGTLTTLNLNGGSFNAQSSKLSRTITTLNVGRKKSISMSLDLTYLTITNGLDNLPNGPIQLTINPT